MDIVSYAYFNNGYGKILQMRHLYYSLSELILFRAAYDPDDIVKRGKLRCDIEGKPSHLRINYGLKMIRMLEESIAQHDKILTEEFKGDILRLTRMIEKLIIPHMYQSFKNYVDTKYKNESEEMRIRRVHEQIHKSLKKHRY